MYTRSQTTLQEAVGNHYQNNVTEQLCANYKHFIYRIDKLIECCLTSSGKHFQEESLLINDDHERTLL